MVAQIKESIYHVSLFGSIGKQVYGRKSDIITSHNMLWFNFGCLHQVCTSKACSVLVAYHVQLSLKKLNKRLDIWRVLVLELG